MATIIPQATQQGIVLYGITWQTYQALRREMDERAIRLAFDRGTLEIMSPNSEHEQYKKRFAQLIEALTEELGIPRLSAGSTTWDREDLEQGLEPAECYYISSESQVRGKMQLSLSVDPPPDLAVEIEITRKAIKRLPIYAAMGFKEVWRFNGRWLKIFSLASTGTYQERPDSEFFPSSAIEGIMHALSAYPGADETAWIRSFRAWCAKILSRNHHFHITCHTSSVDACG